MVEVAIVVIITGLLIVLSLPDFNKTVGRYNLDSSARELAADIRSLQQAAIKNESAGFKIMFNTITDSYHLMNTDVGVAAYKTRKLPATVDLVFTNFNNNTLICAANGNPFGRIGGHISLQDRKTGNFLYVVVDSIGRVRVGNSPP